MARVSTYLNFNGNTEQAFEFYRSVFGGEFNGPIHRFKDVPAAPGQPPMPPDTLNMVMHAEQAQHGVQRSPLRIFHALSAAGVAWRGLAVVGLLGFRWSPRSVRSLQLVFLCFVLFWFFVTQVDRYLAPIYGVASFLSVLTVAVMLRRAWALLPARAANLWRPGWITAAPLLLVAWALWVVVPVASQRMLHRSEELASRSGYSLMAQASRLAPSLGPRIVQVGFENAIYFFDGTAIGDWRMVWSGPLSGDAELRCGALRRGRSSGPSRAAAEV